MFFGRDQLVDDLLQLARGHRVVAVLGASGSGKSSLLRAGLVPRLRHTDDPVLRPAAVRILTPGEHPPSAGDRRLVPKGTPGSQADTWLVVDQFEELYTLCQDPEERDVFLDALLQARDPASCLRVLLAVRADFFTAWPRLHGWINDERDRLRLHRQLTHDATTWHHLDRDPRALYRGTRLATAEEAFTTPDTRSDLTTLERDLLAASTTARDDERRAAARTTRRLRQFTGTLSVLLVLALTAGVIAWDQYRTSEQQRHKAVTAQQAAQSRELASRAVQLSEERPEAAMVLALKGYRQAPTTEARSSLLSAYGRFYANQFTGHTKAVISTAFAPDGRSLATGSRDHSVKLWDAHSHRLLATLTGHTGPVWGLSFSPDGRTLATGSNDGSLKLWDTRSHRLLATLTGHTNRVARVVFSPDGRMLASTSSDYTVRLWDARTHQERAVLTGHTYAGQGLSFSPDGRTLASADSVGTTRLWEVSTHKTLAVLDSHTDSGGEVAFSPDGHTLATSGDKRGVRLWDVDSHRLLTALTGHTQPVLCLSFSPDGRTLASPSSDGTVRLWRPRARKALATLNVEQPVTTVAFSPDGHTLATPSDESAVRLWDVASRRPVTTLTGRTGAITSPRSIADRDAVLTVDYDNQWSAGPRPGRAAARRPSVPKPVTASVASSDGHVLATAGDENAVRVWNRATGRRIATLNGATGTMRSLAITPDGSTLAAASADGTIRVWDVATRRTAAVLREARTVRELALRPDGRALAYVSTNDTTRLWTLHPGQTSTPLSNPKTTVNAMTFSPDSQTLAEVSNDGTIRMWDIATRRTTATLTAHTSFAGNAVFSPDGSTLAAPSIDGSIRLWNTRTNHVRATITAPTVGRPTTVRFSPNGHALATVGPDNATLIWSTDADTVATRICRLSTAHHWTHLLPDQPVKEQCPS
ncbi:hypothetical protein [Streptomyces platensis]|uniref:WD40 repeat domain-containing protein n=1 Tax=Streptomyces platensis TaxID=58346 RepID=UPI0037922D33